MKKDNPKSECCNASTDKYSMGNIKWLVCEKCENECEGLKI